MVRVADTNPPERQAQARRAAPWKNLVDALPSSKLPDTQLRVRTPPLADSRLGSRRTSPAGTAPTFPPPPFVRSDDVSAIFHES